VAVVAVAIILFIHPPILASIFFFDVLVNNLVREPLYFYFASFLLMPRNLLNLSFTYSKHAQINAVDKQMIDMDRVGFEPTTSAQNF
jgi:hypothetical protein